MDLASLGVSVVPPQGGGWCMSPLGTALFTFSTHRLMGKYLESAPSQAEQAHTMGLLITAGPPPTDARLESPEDLAAFAQRLMVSDPRRFRILEFKAVQDSSRGADCIRFDSIVEERNNPGAPGAILVIVNRENYLCRQPYVSPPSLVLFGASERYVQGTVRPPLLLDTLKTQWEPSIRSVEFLHSR